MTGKLHQPFLPTTAMAVAMVAVALHHMFLAAPILVAALALVATTAMAAAMVAGRCLTLTILVDLRSLKAIAMQEVTTQAKQ